MRCLIMPLMARTTGNPSFFPRTSKSRQDLLVASLLVGAVYLASWWLNIAERFADWAEQYEYVQIDELAVALLFAALASAWFSARRVHDLRIETQKRVEAERVESLTQMKFRTLFDESLCGNFICNRQGEILLHNESFDAMSGHMGQRLNIAQALGNEWQGIMTSLANTGGVTFEHLQVARPDGAPWVVMARFALADSSAAGVEIHGFFADITELHLVEQEITVLLEENRALTRHANQVEEDERRRIAREIHDDMGQYLTAIQLDAGTLAMHDNKTITDRASSIINNARHIQKTVHSLIRRLRPIGLEDHGLTDAMRHLVMQWGRQHPGVFCDLNMDECGYLPEPIAAITYRIVQEALTNVSRHAQASNVSIAIRKGGDAHVLSIEIQDNGKGFSSGSKGAGFGLIGMRERVESVKGYFSVTSKDGAGVIVHATLPLSNG